MKCFAILLALVGCLGYAPLQSRPEAKRLDLTSLKTWAAHRNLIVESFRENTYLQLADAYSRALKADPKNAFLIYGRAEVQMFYSHYASFEQVIPPAKIGYVPVWEMLLEVRRLRPQELFPLLAMYRAVTLLEDPFDPDAWDRSKVRTDMVTDRATGKKVPLTTRRQVGPDPVRRVRVAEIVRKMKQIDPQHPLTLYVEAGLVMGYGKQTKEEWRLAYDLTERARKAGLDNYLPGARNDIFLWKLAKELNLGQEVMAGHAARANAKIAKLDKNDLFLRSYKQSTPDFPYVK